MKWLMDILKGLAIGLANVVAGLSGGTIAVIVNAYEDLIDFFSNIATHLITALKKHYKLLIGIVFGIIIGAVCLKKLYGIAPLPITGFFAGLVFISLFPLSKSLSFKKGKKLNIINVILMIISLALLITLALLSSGEEKVLTLDFKHVLIMFGLGIIAAIAMVLPGVSGSMILLVLGYYTPVLGLISIHALKNDFLTTFVMLLSLAIGAILGVVLGSKIIKQLLIKCRISTNFVIYGLIIGSLVGMLITGVKANNELLENNNFLPNGKEDIIMHVLCIVLFIVGSLCGYLVNYFNKKKLKSDLKEEISTDKE